MNKITMYGLGVLALLVGALAYADIAYAQLYSGGKGTELTVTEAELQECKQLGIPEFSCNQQTILAARKQVYAKANEANPYKGSGTSMLAQGLGDAAVYLGALIGIFGAISAALFAMSRTKRPQQHT